MLLSSFSSYGAEVLAIIKLMALPILENEAKVLKK
jgi:hypothetical protein